MILYVDIDDTICELVNEEDYTSAKPIQTRIDIINQLYDEGNTIIYWTARGTVTKIDWEDVTRKQFETWGVKYTELKFGKPYYNLFIDDKNIESKTFFENNFKDNHDKKKLIIVGSGASIKNRNLGGIIDSHDKVCRFGGSQIKLNEYKSDAGNKLNFLYQASNLVALGKLKEDMHKNIKEYKKLDKIVFTHSRPHGPRQRKLYLEIKQICNENGIQTKLVSLRREVYRLLKFYGLHELYKKSFTNGYKYPTTGFFAILDLSREFNYISLVGFDKLLNHENAQGTDHYYGGECKTSEHHDLICESIVIKKLSDKMNNKFTLM